MKQININDEIYVRLTDLGEIQLAKLNKFSGAYNYRFENGKLCISLKEFMQIFGPNIMDNHYIVEDSFLMEDEKIVDYETTSKKIK